MASIGLENTDIGRALTTAVFQTRLTQYTFISGMVIWAYDILLTLNDEFELLWTRGGHLVKLFYIINRYLPLVAISIMLIQVNAFGRGPMTIYVNVSRNLTRYFLAGDSFNTRCRVHYLVITICEMVGVMVATTIFTVRIYTIYKGNRIVQLSLVTLAVASYVSLIVCYYLVMVEIWRTMVYSITLEICGASWTTALGGVFVTPIILESVIAFATLCHAIKFRNHRRDLALISTAPSLLNALYVDGIAYYLIVIFLRIGTCLVYWLAPPTLLLLPVVWEYLITSTVTSRWFLSFRRVLNNSLTPQTSMFGIGTSNSYFTGGAIDFTPVEGTCVPMGNLGPKGREDLIIEDNGQDTVVS